MSDDENAPGHGVAGPSWTAHGFFGVDIAGETAEAVLDST
jgi:hypothetical protein